MAELVDEVEPSTSRVGGTVDDGDAEILHLDISGVPSPLAERETERQHAKALGDALRVEEWPVRHIQESTRLPSEGLGGRQVRERPALGRTSAPRRAPSSRRKATSRAMRSTRLSKLLDNVAPAARRRLTTEGGHSATNQSIGRSSTTESLTSSEAPTLRTPLSIFTTAVRSSPIAAPRAACVMSASSRASAMRGASDRKRGRPPTNWP